MTSSTQFGQDLWELYKISKKFRWQNSQPVHALCLVQWNLSNKLWYISVSERECVNSWSTCMHAAAHGIVCLFMLMAIWAVGWHAQCLSLTWPDSCQSIYKSTRFSGSFYPFKGFKKSKGFWDQATCKKIFSADKARFSTGIALRYGWLFQYFTNWQSLAEHSHKTDICVPSFLVIAYLMSYGEHNGHIIITSKRESWCTKNMPWLPCICWSWGLEINNTI